MKTLIVFLVASVFSEAFLTTFRKDVVISTPSVAYEQKAVFSKIPFKEFIPAVNAPVAANTTPGTISETVKEHEVTVAAAALDHKTFVSPSKPVTNIIHTTSPATVNDSSLAIDKMIVSTEEAAKNNEVKEALPVNEILEEEAGTAPAIVKSVAPATTEVEVKAPALYTHAVETINGEKPADGIIVHTAAYSNAPEAAASMVRTAEMNRRAAYTLSYAASRKVEAGAETYSYMTLYEKAEQLKEYAKAHHYNTEYGFIVNMGMRSGKKRFFIVDLTTMTIIKNGVVAHGRGDSRFTLDKKYSNKKGSNCTSLGIYKVGRSYEGIFGKSFRLFGLEKTNSNAYKRAIVLHSMHNIPNDEIDYPIFQSEGCPSVSPEFLDNISSILHHSSKPVLMWVFDPSQENSPLYSMK